MARTPLKYLSKEQAAMIDEVLMGPKYQYTLQQLMELAGLSVACAVQHRFPAPTVDEVVVLCGPGNNGGDGLVAARHLKLFSYPRVSIVYPIEPKKEYYKSLLQQAALSGVTVTDTFAGKWPAKTVVVDAIFGFSFAPGNVREPYRSIIEQVNGTPYPVMAVDIPSGWDVEEGDLSGSGAMCLQNVDSIVSLTLPKLCVQRTNGGKGFTGAHYIGGRFVPEALATEHNLWLPAYEGASQVYIDTESA